MFLLPKIFVIKNLITKEFQYILRRQQFSDNDLKTFFLLNGIVLYRSTRKSTWVTFKFKNALFLCFFSHKTTNFTSLKQTHAQPFFEIILIIIKM